MPSQIPYALSSIRYEPVAPVEISAPFWPRAACRRNGLYQAAVPVDNSAQDEKLFQAVCRLPERLSRVVMLRFYGEKGIPLKLAEIGKRLGVCDERVRQLLKKAYCQLRNTSEEFLQ
jgi:RNA polymerase sigma factor (sigma-70 family)